MDIDWFWLAFTLIGISGAVAHAISPENSPMASAMWVLLFMGLGKLIVGGHL